MADQARSGSRRKAGGAADGDRHRGGNGCGDHVAAPDVAESEDQGAVRADDLSAAAGRAAETELTSALSSLTQTQWAILKELRNGRKYREQNPPALPALGDRLGLCEQCGAWLETFDDLLHHQFAEHLEIFQEQADLFGEQPRCLCSSCSPAAFREWLDSQPAPAKSKRG